MVEISDRTKAEDHPLLLPTRDRLELQRPSPHDHVVQFYDDEADLDDAVIGFLAGGLRIGDPAVVIATAAHRHALQLGLERVGFDVERLLQSGALTFLDADEALSGFMRAGEPDPALFDAHIGSLIERLAAPSGALRAYGEMVDVLWARGERTAALRLEELWNDLQDRHRFALLCAYSMASFYKEPAGVRHVCATHTRVVARDAPPGDLEIPDGEQARRYAHQLVREIAHRSEVELALRESLRTLRRREEQLRQSQLQLQTIIDALPVLVAYINSEGRYELVSAAYRRWFGFAETEIRDRHVAEVLGEAAYRVVQPHLARAMAGELVSYEAELPYRTGPRFVHATYVPQRDPDGRVAGMVSLVVDITERKSFEHYRATTGERAQRLLTITSALAAAVTTREVLEAVVDRVASALDASSAALWLVDDDRRTIRLARAVGYAGTVAQAFDELPLDVDPPIPSLDAIRRAEPIWLASQAELLRDYPHLASTATAGRSYRISCLPLISHGRTLGALGVTIDEAREPTEEERSFLLLVARYAGQAIERMRLLEGERASRAEADAAATRMAVLSEENARARHRAEQLYRFAHAASAADRVEDVFEAGLDAIERALGTDRAAVLLYDDAGVMRFRAWRNLSEPYRRGVEGHSPWPRDAVAPRPVLIDDVAADASLAGYLPLLRSEGIGSLAFVPLVTRGRLLGKFMVYHGEPHAYSRTELDLATAIANHLASVISRFAAMAELEHTIHYNELFAGALAHDLRNPLGAIMTAAQLLLMRQEGEGDRNAKPLSRILSSGERMARMIDQLLDFTRARAGGGIDVVARDTNLADLCSQAIGELELVYTDRKFRCSFVGDHGGIWDPDRLLQIISNLVANASQHGATGSPIAVRLDGRDAGVVVLEVHNEGAIAPALLPTLFDPFRGTRHRREHSRGLGLGLFIVKELVRAHGGTVGVTSTEADGTAFTIRLPRRPSRDATGADPR